MVAIINGKEPWSRDHQWRVCLLWEVWMDSETVHNKGVVDNLQFSPLLVTQHSVPLLAVNVPRENYQTSLQKMEARLLFRDGDTFDEKIQEMKAPGHTIWKLGPFPRFQIVQFPNRTLRMSSLPLASLDKHYSCPHFQLLFIITSQMTPTTL